MGGKSYSKTKIKIQRWDNSPARQGECPISESNPHAGIKHSTVATPRVNNLVSVHMIQQPLRLKMTP